MAKVHKSNIVTFLPTSPAHPGNIAGRQDDFVDARTQGILDEAEKTGQKLIEQAVIKAAEIRQKAEGEGYRDGLASARCQADDQLADLKETVDQAIEELEARHKSILEDMESDLLELSFAISEKVLKIELDRSDTAFLGIVADAMSRFKQEDRLIIKTSRSDYWRTMVSSSMFNEQSERISMIPDDSLEDYSLLIDSPTGCLDAGLKTRLAKVRDGLMGQTGDLA